ncbi:unnamed protein product, partial [Discosporangium mesarthrocarpum]
LICGGTTSAITPGAPGAASRAPRSSSTLMPRHRGILEQTPHAKLLPILPGRPHPHNHPPAGLGLGPPGPRPRPRPCLCHVWKPFSLPGAAEAFPLLPHQAGWDRRVWG